MGDVYEISLNGIFVCVKYLHFNSEPVLRKFRYIQYIHIHTVGWLSVIWLQEAKGYDIVTTVL